MFDIIDRLVGDVEPILYKKPAGEAEFAPGMLLKEEGGLVTGCTGAEKPLYLCAGKLTGKGEVPVIPVLPTTRFGAVCAVKLDKSLIGSKLQLDGAGAAPTAQTGGAFRLTGTDEADASYVTGYFD